MIEVNDNKDVIPEPKVIYRSLSIITLLHLLSLYSTVPIWLAVLCGLVAIYSFAFYRDTSLVVRTVLTIASIAIFALFYRLNFTVEMASAFLMLSATLKLLEIKKQKDIYLFVFVMLYLSAVSFLFEQTIPHTFLQIVVLVACFSTLMIMNSSSDLLKLGRQWSSLFKLIVLAIPLVVICFMFFPRIAPLWSIPIKAKDAASNGISSSMSPGQIAELSQSAERAFRAEFAGDRPEQKDLYWRGLVLDQFDGQRWTQNPASTLFVARSRYDLGRFYGEEEQSYSVMLEPHNEYWVFALEGSTAASTNLMPADMGLYRLKNEAIQPTRYKFEYQPDDNLADNSLLPTGRTLSKKKRKDSLSKFDIQVPSNSNLRTQEYIADIRQRYESDIELVSHLLSQFSQKEFYYTLRPPVLGENFVDEFFFESKRGFCEHYASTLAYMLRLAGIPSRVVIGYQGGEWNADQGYLIVRQYDAHAWVEAHFVELGWVRLDPTALIAPDRVLFDLSTAIQDEGTFLEDNPLLAAAMSNSAFAWARLRLDELNYQWQKWVVNYGDSEQQNIIKGLLGEYSLSRIIWFFVVTFGAVCTIIGLYLFRPYFKSYSAAQRRYLFWMAVLKRFGHERKIGESPRQFLARTSDRMHPKLLKITTNTTKSLEAAEYERS